MIENLRQIVYASAAVHLMRDSELLEILVSSRANNAQLNVTGILLYSSGAFIQVLEGDPQTTERLLRKIKRDIRHRGFLILLDRVVHERDFEGWSMTFERVSQQELDEIAGFFDWTADMPTRRRNAVALRLIESFGRAAVGL